MGLLTLVLMGFPCQLVLANGKLGSLIVATMAFVPVCTHFFVVNVLLHQLERLWTNLTGYSMYSAYILSLRLISFGEATTLKVAAALTFLSQPSALDALLRACFKKPGGEGRGQISWAMV
jgi:hypothetical protein